MAARADFEFCLNFLTDLSLPALTELWQRCEAAGIDHVGLADSPMLVWDPMVSGAVGAAATSRVGLMIAVTNSISRDPSVMAGALFTLDSIAPGRIACGIGTGDSALWTVGLKPAMVAKLIEYVAAVKQLLAGEEASYQGRRFKARWKEWTRPVEVPIYLACAGPRLLRAAVQVADGMLVSMGFSDDDLAFVNRTIDEACEEFGRDRSTLKIWWQTTITFAASVEAAMERSLGINTSWMTIGSLEGKRIPPEFVAPLLRFNADMEDAAATYGATDRGKVLVERARILGLYEWLIGRSPGFFGPPDNVARRLDAFAARGMNNWMFYVAQFHGDRFEYLERFAAGVMPLLGSTRSS
jgi:alkanesulfonate monooxygenase SsuD/methylene tetrahydromethanopterin reductase-like flavin-dependent oxidoreductase (luciferase family)